MKFPPLSTMMPSTGRAFPAANVDGRCSPDPRNLREVLPDAITGPRSGAGRGAAGVVRTYASGAGDDAKRRE